MKNKRDGSTTFAISGTKRTVSGVRIVSGVRAQLGDEGRRGDGRADRGAAQGDTDSCLRVRVWIKV